MSIFDIMRKKSVTTLNVVTLTPAQLYDRMDLYYSNNDLYNSIEYTAAYNNLYLEAMKPLRTSVHRSVEFYTAHIAQNVYVIAPKVSVRKAIEQFHKWSNFETSKRLAIRQFALYGDAFYKIVNTPNKVYFETIKPRNVVEFEEDSRGNLTEIRIDTEIEVDERNMVRTEYWTKGDEDEPGYMAIWIHQMNSDTDTDHLGDPREYYPLASFGIDFLPFVHSKFVDSGHKRGDSCTSHALLKIDDANRMATRLEQLLFRYNKPIWAVRANSIDANGRPIPAPKVSDAGASGSDNIDGKDGTIFYLPGNSSMDSMIPDINYGDALSILKAMEDEIEQDLPELKYYSMKESTMSGVAIRSLLAGAIDKAQEAEDNFLQAIEKLGEMALTIGVYSGVFPASLGSYENGDFEHDIECSEMFKSSELEMATILKELVAAGMPLVSAMKKAGYSKEEIEDVVIEKSKETLENNNALVNSLNKFNGE